MRPFRGSRRSWAALLLASAGVTGAGSAARPPQSPLPSFEIVTRRMDVDVDGAPNAYGPAGKPTLDVLANAHYRRRSWAPIVGFLTQDDDPRKPVLQGPHDPFPGYYISQTAFADESRPERDPRRYVDATRISYVVLGDAARRKGVQLGDFVVAHSRRTGRTAFAIVGDDGNPSGDEGSLHLLQALGYPFHDGKNDAVEDADVVLRFYPGSNPQHRFFTSQAQLDQAAEAMGLSRDFSRIREKFH
jgi:hypothetical protein